LEPSDRLLEAAYMRWDVSDKPKVPGDEPLEAAYMCWKASYMPWDAGDKPSEGDDEFSIA